MTTAELARQLAFYLQTETLPEVDAMGVDEVYVLARVGDGDPKTAGGVYHHTEGLLKGMITVQDHPELTCVNEISHELLIFLDRAVEATKDFYRSCQAVRPTPTRGRISVELTMYEMATPSAN